MAEQLLVDSRLSKEEKYRSLYPQLEALLGAEKNAVANAANIAGALKEVFGFFWIGFYFIENDKDVEELVLGPFQGPVACTRIGYGRGVCGSAWKEKKTLIVEDVEKFPGHIACSSLSRSEIVVPLIKDGIVIGVLDADSDMLSAFDETDAEGLGRIAGLYCSSI